MAERGLRLGIPQLVPQHEKEVCTSTVTGLYRFFIPFSGFVEVFHYPSTSLVGAPKINISI